MYQSGFPWLQKATRQSPPSSIHELCLRAQALAGRTLQEVAHALGAELPSDPKRAKGFVGQLVELALGADPRAGDRPDFVALGVELKTIPLRPNGIPVESTFCCAITMAEADRAEWATCRLRRKLDRVLWVPVEDPKAAPLPKRRLGRAVLWEPSITQWEALRADWELLMGYIGSGGAASLTGHDGRLLQVRPKAARASDRTLAPGEGGVAPTLPLGFYLRPQFTAEVLRAASGPHS